jgi:hypothetical protein
MSRRTVSEARRSWALVSWSNFWRSVTGIRTENVLDSSFFTSSSSELSYFVFPVIILPAAVLHWNPEIFALAVEAFA